MFVKERGANLSGGQRQRLSLARSVYNDSGIVHILCMQYIIINQSPGPIG
jgi:ABC-type phosphate transport system ATPase subunit